MTSFRSPHNKLLDTINALILLISWPCWDLFYRLVSVSMIYNVHSGNSKCTSLPVSFLYTEVNVSVCKGISKQNKTQHVREKFFNSMRSCSWNIIKALKKLINLDSCQEFCKSLTMSRFSSTKRLHTAVQPT